MLFSVCKDIFFKIHNQHLFFKKNDILYPDYGYHNGLIILNTPFYNNPSIVYNVIGVDDLKHIEFLFKYESFLKIF